jgi:hypothetical protein
MKTESEDGEKRKTLQDVSEHSDGALRSSIAVSILNSIFVKICVFNAAKV